MEDLTRWLSMGAPPKNQSVDNQIKELRKELRIGQGLSTPAQELQAIQKYGSCELKSMYSYFKHSLSPIAYAIIRREIIAEARNMLLGKQVTEQKAPSEEIITEAVSLSTMEEISKIPSNEESLTQRRDSLNIEVRMRLLNEAREKLIRADHRFTSLIESYISQKSVSSTEE